LKIPFAEGEGLFFGGGEGAAGFDAGVERVGVAVAVVIIVFGEEASHAFFNGGSSFWFASFSDGMRIENPLIRISNLMYMNHLAINYRRLIRMALVHYVAG